MEALKVSTCFPPFNLKTPRFSRIIYEKKLNFYFPLNHQQPHKSRFNLFTTNINIKSTISTNEVVPNEISNKNENEEKEKFDWYAQWYPIMPISELDKRRPHGKKVMGIDLVVWWDSNLKEWRVMDDACSHRLAPLSQGRIDQWGRLQCVYHGWCFNGVGDCKFIPQAPTDKPQVHTSKRACVSVYPSFMQNDILWFWPNSDLLYKDIHLTKCPPYIPLFDDTSCVQSTTVRDIPYGEGGKPLDISLTKLDINGYIAGEHNFIAPCVYYGPFCVENYLDNESKEESSNNDDRNRTFMLFICVPVSPGNSRLIMTSFRTYAVWEHKLFPPWIFHLQVNLIVDSDLYLLHLQEHKLREKGPHNWQKVCYVPTKADALVVGFRRWLNKYGGAQVDWDTKFTGDLPPTPAREQLLDRYWTHTVQCSSCNRAYKGLNAFEIILQIMSVASIGIAAAAKESVMSIAARYSLVLLALLCFMASKWLSKFIYKSFHFHDYDHAFH